MESATTLRCRLAEYARERPGIPALLSPERMIRYGELPALAESLAIALRARGVGPGATVGLTVRRETDHLVASVALLRLGVVQFTLASHDSPAMRERLARRIRATHVVGDSPDDAVAGLPCLELERALAAARERPHAAALASVDPHAPALVLTGSGTTGEPKILRFSQHDLALQAGNSGQQHGARALRAAHVEHNTGKRNRLYSLWGGRTCILAEGNGALRDVGLRLGATAIEAPPLRVAGLVAACRRDGAIPAVAVRTGGTMVPWSVRRDVLEQVTPLLYVAYGATEAGNICVAGPGSHDERELVGRPADGVDVRILREDGTPAGVDEPGEIAVRTPGMASAYVDDPVETRRRFHDGWFLPGDRVSMAPDGQLRVLGRADDMMILNSINIFPSEIERALETHPGVAEAAAFPIASRAHGQIPVAAIALRAGADCGRDELLAYARARLGLRAPRRIEIVDALPRNPQGKVLRRELALRFASASDE